MSKMTAQVLADKAVDIAKNYKTTYMLGPWGWPCTDKMITRATTQGTYAQTNKQWLSSANAIKNKGFIFDCIGLIKGILWGWSGDMSRTYGGAGYATNGVPDIGADTMIAKCSEVSTTGWDKMVIGEAVWMSGHIGVYIGDGLAVECTPKWDCGVQITAVATSAASPAITPAGGPSTAKCPMWTTRGPQPAAGPKAPPSPARPPGTPWGPVWAIR